jgi:hypothetical protein
MVFTVTTGAIRRHLATWHCHEKATGAFDYFQITNYKTIVKRNTAKRL